jgi:hypothetical protein
VSDAGEVVPWQYGPPLLRPILLLAAAAGCVAGAFVITALWAPAAVLALAAARDLRCRPALALDADGLRYVVGLHHKSARWSDVAAIRVRHERHFLAFGHHVEIDLNDETLVVLSNFQLGAPAQAVADELEATRQRAIRSTKPF